MVFVPAIIYTLAVLLLTGYIYRWRNPKCRGLVLPPGSSGFPLIGEAFELLRPSSSLDLLPFLKSRISRYGQIFRTNIAGKHAVVSADQELNRFLLRRDRELMEPIALSSLDLSLTDFQILGKHLRKFVLHQFGVELLKEKLLEQVEETCNQTLHQWSTMDSVEMKGAAITMTVSLAVKQFFSGDLEIEPRQLSQMLRDFTQWLVCLPLNFPGTTHHKRMKIEKKIKRLFKAVVQKRLAATAVDEKSHRGDLLDEIIQEIGGSHDQEQIIGDRVAQFFFSLLFVTSESISTTLTLAFNLLHDHPAVLEELAAEQEVILEKRENIDSPLSWSEYKSMTFTDHVINEVLRLMSGNPWLFRRAIKDIPANGYVIPKGWGVFIATSASHLDPNQFEDPLSFNPWRWKSIEPEVVSRCFLPFGSGMRQCTGSEYGKAFLSTFFHVLVTKYRFTMVKRGKFTRAPILAISDGFHFKISEKSN